MAGFGPNTRVFVGLEPVDMRASFDALAGHVHRLHSDPLDGHIYLFVNRRRWGRPRSRKEGSTSPSYTTSRLRYDDGGPGVADLWLRAHVGGGVCEQQLDPVPRRTYDNPAADRVASVNLPAAACDALTLDVMRPPTDATVWDSVDICDAARGGGGHPPPRSKTKQDLKPRSTRSTSPQLLTISLDRGKEPSGMGG